MRRIEIESGGGGGCGEGGEYFKCAKFIFLGDTLIQKSAGRYSGYKHSLPPLAQMQ
jgi:hypothetical protein